MADIDIGAILKFIPSILKGINAANRVKDAKGAEKKAMAIKEAVKDGAAIGEQIAGKDAINDAALEALAGHVIDGIFAGKKAIEAGRVLKNPDGLPATQR